MEGVQRQLQFNQKQLTEMMDFKKDHETRLTKTETKIEELESKLKREEEINLRLEMERSEYILRIQNAEEKNKEGREDIFTMVTEALAEFMEMEPLEVSNELDQVFRTGNSYTKRNKLPQEIHIKCVRKSFRDEVLLQTRSKSFQINQKEVKIIKDLPWRIRAKRKEYQSISKCLQRNKIDYRWLIPEGLLFSFQGTRYKINSIFKAQAF